MWELGNLRTKEVRRLCLSIREVLEMKNMAYMGAMRRSFRILFRKRHPGEPMPLAPLRAISYASAGGAFSSISVANQLPASALMKIGYEKGCNNVYTNKVVLLDETHNLCRTQTKFAQQLQRLRGLLTGAKQHVLVAFTGTPILSHACEGRQLLDIVKGNAASALDEGFLSSFTSRPRALFPAMLPAGVPDALLTKPLLQQLVKQVQLRGESLKVYDAKRQLGVESHRLRTYCNMSCYYASFHDGKNGSKARIMANVQDLCPKLYAIAEDVATCNEKTIVMVGRPGGYTVLLEVLRRLALESEPPFAVATMEELSEFNHATNLRGERYRVLVADAAQCSEGVSFLAVRQVLLAEVPLLHSMFVQQCGRAVRMYSHSALPHEEQTVTVRLYSAVLPQWMGSPLGCLAYRAQRQSLTGADMEARARLLLVHFLRAGISSFEELKTRLDGHCKDLLGASLSSDAIADFLESNGLWEDARLVRGKKASAKSRGGSGGTSASTNSTSDTSGLPKLRGLAQVLQNVLVAPSIEVAAASYVAQTADEQALQQLGEHAAQVVPALVSLRSAAVDRELFEALDVHGQPAIENAGQAENTAELDEAIVVEGNQEIGTMEATTDEPEEEPAKSLSKTIETNVAAAETRGEGADATASIANMEVRETVGDSHEASLTAGGTEAATTATNEREMHETTAVEPSQQSAEVGIHMHAAPKRGLSDVAADGTRRVRLRTKTKQQRGFS